ncbi:hypothetical protein [Tellurirhabdus rosea]|uniref:hypothetical protein n=1 Tax=Tellurirhabdus rosea TaxID=2674997 RepID=UPI002251B970|nr:hypothetical protein [Tellurirhabdus rosea]
MATFRKFLPGFRAICLTIGILDVLMAGSLFAKGLMVSMAEFRVPQPTLDSPHYHNAIEWVYTHMIVLGLVLIVLGLYGEGQRFRRWMARLLFVVHAYYTYLDFRYSDSALGNGLYQGPASVFPALFGLFATLLFLRLVIWEDEPVEKRERVTA